MALTVIAAGTIPAPCHAQPQAAPALAQSADPAAVAGRWTAPLLDSLQRWLARSDDFGLPLLDLGPLAEARRRGDAATLDRVANALALQLARQHALGWMNDRARGGWHIPDSDRAADLQGQLGRAVATGSLDRFLDDLQPLHPDFSALRESLWQEADPARRATIARNMERWRWLPRGLGDEYLLVNTAAFTVELWRGGRRVDRWRVIVGKPSSPTPVFAAMVTGVTLNPWWDIPPSIVRESVGGLVRRNPKLAARRGYVWGGGRYRQRPGAGNALGTMKLAMANPFNVYLHDTPTKALFDQEVRAFSHGCVRVDRPLDLAAALLGAASDRVSIDRAVASGRTVTLPLAHAIPVYIAYFTAEPAADGAIQFLPDIYGRDSIMGDAKDRRTPSPA
ncbi:L,D-transpeptidase family protein [Novosphingobium cyanobacteriorum]|uniref:L,D-transpeptidase family protein n=1 Tax=Novosphingobium cyanobacteriorum TaxID=3024215 RepID=A0ABT6CHB3_9SPHN|nr:L,D-transpeptidase family protein [Novosphingobium cyanobacteriorum]MDF8332445.1 L,D-transpeptidase family protein [Novosphingobium cyanobacteriorum]